MKIAVHTDLAAGEIAVFETFNIRADRAAVIFQLLRKIGGWFAEPVCAFLKHLGNTDGARHDRPTPLGGVLAGDWFRRESIHIDITCQSTVQFSRAASY